MTQGRRIAVRVRSLMRRWETVFLPRLCRLRRQAHVQPEEPTGWLSTQALTLFHIWQRSIGRPLISTGSRMSCLTLSASSGRQMLEAIIAGQDDAEQLAKLARGKLKNKIPQLEQAMAGRIRDHHRFLLAEYLDEWEALGQRIVRLEAAIDKRIHPFEQVVALWQTIPGIDRVTACNLVAEIGVEMNQFPTAQQLASWAALCPGNHESAGKRKTGRTRNGNKWLRRSLCQAAWAVTRKKDCYLSAQFKRLAARRGVKRAVMAVAHTMLIIGYYMLKTGRGYHELGGNYLEQINKDQLQRYFLRRLQRLGLKVTVEPVPAAA